LQLRRNTPVFLSVAAFVACFRLTPGSAHASFDAFVVDPMQSFLQIDPTSSAVLDMSPPLPDITLSLPSQVGCGGSAGMLPDGSTSDGLQASVSGSLLVEFTNNHTEISIVDRRTTLRCAAFDRPRCTSDHALLPTGPVRCQDEC
jgi:hypothetical protein